jgi:hypothetical protein
MVALILLPQICRACACGCGIFEVGTATMIPQGTGGLFYIEYDYQDQNQNWSGSHSAPAADNPDKEIRTSFYTMGLQYMFNRNWGIQAELPVDNRYFQTTGGASGTDIVSLNWTDIGDMRIQGIYTGFLPDQSLGILFGAKLPTGNDTENDFFGDIDRDSEIGTGSTDILLGAFYRNNLTQDGKIDWFTQINFDLPVLSRNNYRPGLESDAALGIYYNGLAIRHLSITPIGQILGSVRARDTGAESANPVASGYERIFLSPGIEFDLHPVMLYADVELPVYEHITGNQLVASNLFKMIVSYRF